MESLEMPITEEEKMDELKTIREINSTKLH